MKESDVRNDAGLEKGQLPPVGGKGDAGNAGKPPERKADEEWLAFATEDPAFFIKPSDAV